MKATFFTNSFNQLPLLRNMLWSFEQCNHSKDVEWVVTDYGSADGSREWLQDYAEQSSVPVRLIIKDEHEFFEALRVPMVDRRARVETILRKYRNEARATAQGEYLFDIGADHQFIREADFVREVEEVFRHREQQTGKDDLSGVFVFGYFRWRLAKPNNALSAEANRENIPYFVAKEKAYVDYSVMRRRTINKVGPYLEVGELVPNSPEMKAWLDGKHMEMEYIDRCAKVNLKRAMLKYPISISFTNEVANELVKTYQNNRGSLIASLWTLDGMKKHFSELNRPVSSEELWAGVRMKAPLLTRALSLFAH